MCQVLPFTLPCCRRIYVEVTKLPSCPEAWPESKCPPELCIQVRGYEAEDRDTGTCWRCQADIAGGSDEDRENLRPGIDSAMIVHGLDEAGVSGRRRIVDEGGNCWYCRAKAGCEYCGAAIKIEAGAGMEKAERSRNKRPRDDGGRKENVTSKRIKVERRDKNQSQTPAFSYPDPEQPSQWQNVFPISYNNMPFTGGYGIAPGSNMTDFGSPWSQPFSPQVGVPGTSAVDWAALHNEQNNAQIGFGSGQKSSQNFTTQSSVYGPQGEPFFNDGSCQSLYPPDPGLVPDVKPRVQPEVRATTPQFFSGCRNKLQICLENPVQMENATLAHLLDTYNNQNPNFGHDPGHRGP
jgi:hypothetical protein